MIQVKKITFTPANIYAMFVTPQVALAAPASGYVNNILGITHDLVFVSAAYAGTSTINYGAQTGGANLIFTDTAILVATVSLNMQVRKFNSAAVGAFTTTKDFYVTTSATATTGDSPIIAYIVYETKVIS